MQDDSSSSSDLEQEDLDRLPRSQDSDFDHEIDESDSADGAEVLDEAEEDDSEEEAESGVPVDSCFIPDRPIPRRSRYRLHELCGAGLIEDIKQYLSNEVRLPENPPMMVQWVEVVHSPPTLLNIHFFLSSSD